MNDVVVPTLIPHGVADASGTTGYVADRAGGILAIDLKSGKVLWSTSAATRPLLVIGSLLAAGESRDPNTLRVVLLDSDRRGEVTLVSEPVIFPEWVEIGQYDNDSFRMRATARNNQLLLDWEAHMYYKGGAAPSATILQQTGRDAAGVAQVDLTTGAVVMLAKPESPAESSLAPAADVSESPLAEPERGALETTVVNDRIYYLMNEVTQQQHDRVVMKAVESGSGKVLWELPLDERPVQRKPPPLRP
jgi:hypothetical protein